MTTSEPQTPTLGAGFERRFRLEQLIGEGGFASVYRGLERETGRRVAVKLLRQRDTGGYDPEDARRYRREIDILASLRSPNIVRLLDHGTGEDGTLYLVFEHVDGEELAALLKRRGELERDEILHILAQLLTALDEAHSRGALHRDLKPENILIFERDGDPLSVKLIDFGIARSMHPTAPTITQTGALIGTPRYMSPEQLLKRPLGPASDIYSLGLIAFEMALGRDALHGGAFGDQIDRLVSGHVFSVPALDRVGEDVHQVISQMCQRDLDERLQNVAQVRAALGMRVPRVVIEPRRSSLLPFALIALALGIAAYLMKRPKRVDVRPEPVVQQLGADDDRPLRAATPTAPKQPDDRPTQRLPAYATGGCDGDSDLHSDAVYLPADYDHRTPHPVVVLLHDAATEPEQYRQHSGLRELADKERFILVTPRSSRLNANDTTWAVWSPKRLAPILGTSLGGNPPRDVAELVRLVQARLCVDDRRIYAVGHGRGAEGAQRLACELPLGGIVAIATIPARPYCGQLDQVPFLRINVRDVPPRRLWLKENNVNDIDVSFAELRRCTASDDAPFRRSDPSEEVCRTWACPGGMRYESCLLDGNRQWPGVDQASWAAEGFEGDPPREANYAERAWTFLDSLDPRLRFGSVGQRAEDEVDAQ